MSSFLRKTCQAHVHLIAGFILLFCLGSHQLLQRQAAADAVERAQICASVLTPDAQGQLAPAILQLLDRNPGLLAIGVQDALGQIAVVYPEQADYRDTAVAATKTFGSPLTSSVEVFGISQKVCAISLPINGNEHRSAQRVVFVMRIDEGVQAWAIAVTLVALVVFVLVGATVAWQSRWLTHRVSTPLTKAIRYRFREGNEAEAGIEKPTDLPDEVQSTLGKIGRLSQELAIANRKIRRIERLAENDLRDTEAGFNRKLRRAKDQAIIDPLTGLHNRRFLQENLEPIFAECASRQNDLSIVMLDVDNFKNLNDTLGHQAGDDLLVFIGQLLRSTIRPTDCAIRLGGDEFVLLLPETDARQAAHVAERITKLFAQHAKVLPSIDTPPSLSAGVGSLKTFATDEGSKLLSHTDKELYRAKAKGKNTVAWAHS